MRRSLTALLVALPLAAAVLMPSGVLAQAGNETPPFDAPAAIIDLEWKWQADSLEYRVLHESAAPGQIIPGRSRFAGCTDAQGVTPPNGPPTPLVIGPGYGGRAEVTDLAGRYDIVVQYRHPCTDDFTLGAAVKVTAQVSLYDPGQRSPYAVIPMSGQVVVDLSINEMRRSSATLGSFTVKEATDTPTIGDQGDESAGQVAAESTEDSARESPDAGGGPADAEEIIGAEDGDQEAAPGALPGIDGTDGSDRTPLLVALLVALVLLVGSGIIALLLKEPSAVPVTAPAPGTPAAKPSRPATAAKPEIKMGKDEARRIIDWGVKAGRLPEDIQRDLDARNETLGGHGTVPWPVDTRPPGEQFTAVDTPRGPAMVTEAEATEYRTLEEQLERDRGRAPQLRARHRELERNIRILQTWESVPGNAHQRFTGTVRLIRRANTYMAEVEDIKRRFPVPTADDMRAYVVKETGGVKERMRSLYFVAPREDLSARDFALQRKWLREVAKPAYDNRNVRLQDAAKRFNRDLTDKSWFRREARQLERFTSEQQQIAEELRRIGERRRRFGDLQREYGARAQI